VIDDHKVKYSQLAAQLTQEEKNERDIADKIKNAHDSIRLYQQQIKDQNKTLIEKDQTISKQKQGLDDITKQLEKQQKIENESRRKLSDF
jgi:hypothetical protein